MNKTHIVGKRWNKNHVQPVNQKVVERTDATLTQSYTCSFKLPTTETESIIVFGDIEGHDNLFESTVQHIKHDQQMNNVSYVFLGDIYDYAKPHKTISQVLDILDVLNVEQQTPFNDETKEIDVIRAFRKLWKQKQLKCYSKYNIQYMHSKPKQSSIKESEYLFILGNKEVIFIQELITSERITKKGNVFTVPADYKRKHKKPGEDDIKHTEYEFTPNELNVMFTYISLCHNYALINETLFIHCYLNYKLFAEDCKVKRIIAGHSKGYGHFVDSNFENVDIYINDLTGIANINEVDNRIVITESQIIHNFNDNFKPVLEKLKFQESEDQDITYLEKHPLSTDDTDYDDNKTSSNSDS